MKLAREIKQFAKSLGFHLVKVIPAYPLPAEKAHLSKWLKHGYSADLKYMQENSGKRANLREILPDAKSVICLGMNYYQPFPGNIPDNAGKVARYAWGKDYHVVIEKKLKKIRQFIIEKSEKNLSKTDFKLYVDAGPVLERAYAAKAGLGFIGKNTTLITKEYGSWVFLSEIITTLELEPDAEKEVTGDCGSCTKCIDACPTKALISPYELDARKCISYQTIENKGEIPPKIKEKMGDRVFGCDICQEVCPHNCRAKKTDIDEFLDHRAGPYLTKEAGSLTEKEFNEKYKGSPLKRAGLKGIIKNLTSML